MRDCRRSTFDRMSDCDLVSARMNETAGEIASQPDCWRTAVGMAPASDADLPHHGQTVAAVGCGTSLYVSRAYAVLREQAGHGVTDAFPASEFPDGRRYDRVVAITRSGTTTEVLRLMGGRDPASMVVITADAGAPAASIANARVVVDFADERSVVQTRFPTTVLALLRTHLGEDLTGAIADAERAMDAPFPVDPDAIDHIVFLGHGWTVGIAEEAALKMREAALMHSEAYPAMEYRHGPISVAGPRSLVWILGSSDDGVADDARTT